MARFSKTRLIEHLTNLERNRCDRLGFDRGNGTSQLWSRQTSVNEQNLIDRAVEYGRWIAIRDMVTHIEDGTIGT